MIKGMDILVEQCLKHGYAAAAAVSATSDKFAFLAFEENQFVDGYRVLEATTKTMKEIMSRSTSVQDFREYFPLMDGLSKGTRVVPAPIENNEDKLLQMLSGKRKWMHIFPGFTIDVEALSGWRTPQEGNEGAVAKLADAITQTTDDVFEKMLAAEKGDRQ